MPPRTHGENRVIMHNKTTTDNYELPESGDQTGTAVQPGDKGEDSMVSSCHAQLGD